MRTRWAAQSIVPPGDYTSGQLRLRSGVRLYLEAGARLFASLNSREFDPAPKSALLHGDDLHNMAIEGRRTSDGHVSGTRSRDIHLHDTGEEVITDPDVAKEAVTRPKGLLIRNAFAGTAVRR